jgi:hypothetical protein
LPRTASFSQATDADTGASDAPPQNAPITPLTSTGVKNFRRLVFLGGTFTDRAPSPHPRRPLRNSGGLSPIPNRYPRMSRRTAEMGRDVPRLILNQIPFNLDSRIGVSPHSALGGDATKRWGWIATTSRRRPLLGARRRLAHSSHREDSYEVQQPP